MSDSAINRRHILGSAVLSVLLSSFMDRADANISARWRDKRRSPDERAAALVKAMTLDEKIVLLQSHIFLPPAFLSMMPDPSRFQAAPADVNGAIGYVFAIPRLGLDSILECDASSGVGRDMSAAPRDVTAFPATILTASTWSPDLARACGAAIGEEARACGASIMLAGGVNLTRDPRCGRTFEYFGEDPVLAGQMAGASIKGIQSQGVASTVKHFALNAQESGRTIVDEVIDPAALRESDLLAFQIAIEIGEPASVMNAYNKINGVYCSQNPWLLTDVLKRDWHYPGFVMSDWGSVHSTREAVLAGLDQQSGEELDAASFFGAPLKDLALRDRTIVARVDEKIHRILRSYIAVGVFDDPPHPGGDPKLVAHAETAQRTAEEGIVLLKNDGPLLPLSTQAVRKIALIGAHADVGVLSGGGSAQVAPPDSFIADGRGPVYHASSPLRALKAIAPSTDVQFQDGADVAAAAAFARESDIAIVVVQRADSEGRDARDLSLPGNQDALVSAVASANPRTIVIATTGGPILMPWLDQVSAVLMAWYPGIRGAEALANVLFGLVNPSGRLPLTFPRSVDDLPRPQIAGIDLNMPVIPNPQKQPPSFSVQMNEGADVGYRWHERRGNKVLFPFGYGLSYTTFSISDISAENARDLIVTCKAANTGSCAGKLIVQVYGRPPQPGAARRLAGFTKVPLDAGESKLVTIKLEPRSFARFDEAANAWQIDAGEYEFAVGNSSADIQQTQRVILRARRLRA